MERDSALTLLVKLCASLNLGDDCLPELVEMLIAFGGIDTEELTFDMVLRGLRREPDANWHELRFSAFELLCYYRAMGVEGMETEFQNPKAALVATIVVMLAATAIPSGIGTGFELAGICLVLYALRDVLYFNFDELVFWIAAEAQHTEKLNW